MISRSKIRVGVPVWPPWSASCAPEVPTLIRNKSRCHLPGSSNEILGYFLEKLKIDYELIPFENVTDWGTPPEDGQTQWGGLLGLLQNGTIDAIGTQYFYTELRLKYFSYTYPTAYVLNSVVYKMENEATTDMLALFRVFSARLWALIGLVCLLFAVCLSVNAKLFERPKKPFLVQMSESLWTVITFFTDQCSEFQMFHMNRSSARLLMGSLGILAFFSISFYEGFLLSSLMNMKKNFKIPFKGLDTLADSIAAGWLP